MEEKVFFLDEKQLEVLNLKPSVQAFWQQNEKSFLSSMAENYWWVGKDPNLFPLFDSLLNKAQSIEKSGSMRLAKVGKGDLKKRVPDIRKDKIHWVEDFGTYWGQDLRGFYENLIQISRKGLFLPAKRFECHFAKYEPGDFYRRHQDQHKFMPNRLLTCVFYLNDLAPGEGGELILYDQDLKPFRVSPERGKLIIFDSQLEHEVRPCSKNRWSLTGWIRSDLAGFTPVSH